MLAVVAVMHVAVMAVVVFGGLGLCTVLVVVVCRRRRRSRLRKRGGASDGTRRWLEVVP